MQKTTVIIPAYEPDKKLETLVHTLVGKIPVLIVDDGSDITSERIFKAVKEMGATVLQHVVNLGKGAALKTAFEYLKDTGTNMNVVTADADGQHSVEDILAVAAALEQDANAVILGVRDVSTMPVRSRVGNIVTRFVFHSFTGLNISDTQTGLRGIPSGMVSRMLEVAGDRYEYEMNMLLALKKWGVAIKQLPIKTIYLEGNRSSHFHPVKDGLQVLAQLFKYTLISLSCAILDYGLYLLLLNLFLPAWSYAMARVCSACVNYQMNRRMVFQARPSARSAFAYAILAGFSMAVGAFGTGLLASHAISSVFAKFLMDAVLFLLNFLVQKRVVFEQGSPYRTPADKEELRS